MSAPIRFPNEIKPTPSELSPRTALPAWPSGLARTGHSRADFARPARAPRCVPLTRSVITLSSPPIKRKRLRQRFGPISVSDQSHGGHGAWAGLEHPAGARKMSEMVLITSFTKFPAGLAREGSADDPER